MELDQLRKIMPQCGSLRAQQMLPLLVAAMDRAEITTPLRIAHFTAQVGHESVDLTYMAEIASGEAYEGRLDLGNTKSGDGKRFKGRGPIQITGRDNYTRFAAWSGLDCVIHPELLEIPANGFLASAWYWSSRDINAFADKDDCLKVSVAINGKRKDGLPNGWLDRCNRTTRAKQVMGC